MTDDSQVSSLLVRTNELLTVLAKSALSNVLEDELKDPKKRKLYELTGGSTPVKAIAAKIGISVGAISAHWKRWEQLGLLVKDGRQYRRVLE